LKLKCPGIELPQKVLNEESARKAGGCKSQLKETQIKTIENVKRVPLLLADCVAKRGKNMEKI